MERRWFFIREICFILIISYSVISFTYHHRWQNLLLYIGTLTVLHIGIYIRNWRYYKKIFTLLKGGQFEFILRSGGFCYYGKSGGDTLNDFAISIHAEKYLMWGMQTGGFAFSFGRKYYLAASVFTLFDPYSFYWLIKINRLLRNITPVHEIEKS